MEVTLALLETGVLEDSTRVWASRGEQDAPPRKDEAERLEVDAEVEDHVLHPFDLVVAAAGRPIGL